MNDKSNKELADIFSKDYSKMKRFTNIVKGIIIVTAIVLYIAYIIYFDAPNSAFMMWALLTFLVSFVIATLLAYVDVISWFYRFSSSIEVEGKALFKYDDKFLTYDWNVDRKEALSEDYVDFDEDRERFKINIKYILSIGKYKTEITEDTYYELADIKRVSEQSNNRVALILTEKQLENVKMKNKLSEVAYSIE